ncbi:PAS domain S-box protein [Candidatus Magnetominusculus xianensis]|uniref:PAS domain S-box protein n=1 Tax=Candidatus Magnetominusculus xianensis TaxID=1748249 RepID=UPI0019F39AD5|nr:transporter substrate-binding domain-containing protein [Candidatus Magnetominusculus xianensis]MBF0402445.1 transporter substrate-binding domain-containing protein [Nitrospirota bacterium]
MGLSLIAAIIFLWYPADSKAQNTPPIKVGSEIDFPPYAIVDANGHASGFSVELIREVAAVMGLSIDIHSGEWNDILLEFKKGNIELLPLVALSKQRADMAAFTKPHTVTYDSFFTRKGSQPINSIADAKGKEIIVMSSDAAHEQLAASGVSVRIVEVKTIPDAMRQLAQGRHDAVLVSKLIGHMVLRKLKLDDAIISGPPINDYNRKFAFAVQKGNTELRDKLDHGIAIVRATGKYDAIYGKWFGDIEPRAEFPWRKIIWIIIIICTVLVLISIWIQMLRRQVEQRTAELQKEVAARRVMETDLRQSYEGNKRLLDALDNVAAYIFIKDMELRYVYANKLTLELFNCTMDELIGSTDARFFSAGTIEGFLANDRRVIENGEVSEKEEETMPKSVGKSIVYWAVKRPIYDAAGKIYGLCGVSTDITERKRMEEELKELNKTLTDELVERRKIEEELKTYKDELEDIVAKRTEELTEVKDRFRTAFDFSTVGVAITSPEKGWIEVNAEVCRMLGYTKDELISMTWTELTHPDDLEADVRLFNRVLDGEISGYIFEKRFICKNGSIVFSSIFINCKRSSDGSVDYFIAILQDISGRKRMEEELKRLNINLENAVVEETQKRRQNEQMLIQQSKMAQMGEMISLISHQWRQPLNAISLTVQDIKDAYNYGELNERYIQGIVDTTMGQVNFMSKTMEDFRNFFKPSKDRLQFNVKCTIEELVSMFEELFKKSGVDISIEAKPGTILTTNGYPNEFKQVILNLINNSKDAISSKHETGPQGLIGINIINNEERDKIIVLIKDNGGGIPEDIAEKIFEPYYTTKGEKGTGIGLYMSKTIIETNMGGTLTVRNVDGGAEFLITLGISNFECVSPPS